MTSIQAVSSPTSAEKTKKAETIVEWLPVFHTEEREGERKQVPVLLVSIPVCDMTKDGLRDTIVNHLCQLRCVAGALRLSKTAVAVIPVEKFDSEQVEAIVCNVARYRLLEPDQYRVRKLKSATPAAKALRKLFCTELPRALSTAGAGAIPLQLATQGSG